MKLNLGSTDHARVRNAGRDDPALRRADRIAAYDPSYRHCIQELTACSTALEDLADAFPGLLFALATGYADAATRMRAVEMILQGAALREIADALGLPWWLRKLPAGAFTSPLVAMPRDNDFAVRMASLVPADAASAAVWLRLVNEAAVSGGRSFALWIARHGLALHAAMPEQRLVMLMAWVWAGTPVAEGTLARGLLRAAWSPDMGIKRVLEEFSVWMQRVALLEWLGSGRLRPWVADGSHHGLMFSTLRTADDFIRAAEALDNCLEQYADRLRSHVCAVASIAKGGSVIACVEIAQHANDPTRPAIVQLRGMRNRRVGIDVWQAAYAWLGAHPLHGVSADMVVPPAADRAHTRRRLWEDYCQHLFLAGGCSGMETRARQLLLSRHCLEPVRASARVARVATAEVVHRPRGHALLGIPDAVIQRLIELFPGTEIRRG